MPWVAAATQPPPLLISSSPPLLKSCQSIRCACRTHNLPILFKVVGSRIQSSSPVSVPFPPGGNFSRKFLVANGRITESKFTQPKRAKLLQKYLSCISDGRAGRGRIGQTWRVPHTPPYLVCVVWFYDCQLMTLVCHGNKRGAAWVSAAYTHCRYPVIAREGCKPKSFINFASICLQILQIWLDMALFQIGIIKEPPYLSYFSTDHAEILSICSSHIVLLQEQAVCLKHPLI